jgi:hypothetical protein
MEYETVRSMYARRRTEAHVVITLVAIAIALMEPLRAYSVETVLFVVVSQFTFLRGLSKNVTFGGYGVAKEINAISKDSNVTLTLDFGELCWHRCAVKPLVHEWLDTALGCACIVLVPMLISIAYGALPKHAVPMVFAYSAARLLALLGEMYVWLMAERFFYWYMTEKNLWIMLQGSMCPKAPSTG